MGKTKTIKETDSAAENKADSVESKETAKTPRVGAAKVRGKKYLQIKSKVDKSKLYTLAEAVALVKNTSYSKFDGTVELHLVTKKEGVTLQAKLPFSAGKAKKVEIADDDTLKKLKEGKVDFDILLATADMMPKLVPFAKILGPKGMMPNPKNGTLIKDKSAAAKFSTGTVTIRTEKKAPLVHIAAGKVSQPQLEIEENITAIINAMGPRQVVRAYVKATMGPSVKLQLA